MIQTTETISNLIGLTAEEVYGLDYSELDAELVSEESLERFVETEKHPEDVIF